MDNRRGVQETLSHYDVVWTTPSDGPGGSMPLGNGDLALNAWVESTGDLYLLLAKSDAWDINSILLKLGRLRVTFDPPLCPGDSFSQRLNLQDASIEIKVGDTAIKVWIDAHAPVVHMEAESSTPRHLRVQLEQWRVDDRPIKPQTGDLFCNLTGPPLYPTIISPDRLVEDHRKDRLAWFHEVTPREHDPFTINMKLQGLGRAIDHMSHPLLHRVFGCAMEGPNLVMYCNDGLRSASAANTHELRIHALTLHPSNGNAWWDDIDQKLDALRETLQHPDAREQVWTSHKNWWHQFWERSWISISSSTDPQPAFQVSRAYVLQRFMNACAGRGSVPIKHNGSLFSVGRDDNPDFRRWGGAGFWFMNQRLIYWPMLMAGDFDLMMPWLKMYLDSLWLQKLRTETYFGHEGAHFPETITFWGSEISSHYGWTPFEQRAKPEAECPYLTYYWSGGIELTLILLEFALHGEDAQFAHTSLSPIAREVMTFFDQHYPRDASGKLRFEPAQVLETWHDAINPLPEIAGLRYVLNRLIDLPTGWLSIEDLEFYSELLKQLPEIPEGDVAGERVILPAERFDKLKNRENPELYCVFPYRLFGVSKPELSLAKRTFAVRRNVSHTCWSQDDIQMALLGMAREAKENLIRRSSPECHSESRFPAFWNAFSDWIPDIDHGGVLQLALQFVLMQCEGRKILLLPAWPAEWDADFKLHAPFQTIIEGEVRNGKLTRLSVSPPERRSDVQILGGEALP